MLIVILTALVRLAYPSALLDAARHRPQPTGGHNHGDEPLGDTDY